MSLKRFLLVRLGQLVCRTRSAGSCSAVRGRCHEPRGGAGRLLLRILAQQADTGFGRDHRFAAIRTVADYRRQRPDRAATSTSSRTSSACRTATPRACSGRPRVHMFALTSGTTASRKLIPVTDAVPRRLQARLEHLGPEDVPRPPRAAGRHAADRADGRRPGGVPHPGRHPVRQRHRLHRDDAEAASSSWLYACRT